MLYDGLVNKANFDKRAFEHVLRDAVKINFSKEYV